MYHEKNEAIGIAQKHNCSLKTFPYATKKRLAVHQSDFSCNRGSADEGRLGNIEEGEGRLWLARRKESLEGRREHKKIKRNRNGRFSKKRSFSVTKS